jgi:hypothetical protein
MKFPIDGASSMTILENIGLFFNLAQAIVRNILKTIYEPRTFQRVQICEDRSLVTGDMSGQTDCLKVKNRKAYNYNK